MTTAKEHFMKIITSGQAWIDIDALACGTAYTELLGSNAKLILPGFLNATVSKTIRSFDLNFASTYQGGDKDKFILVDVSNPGFFANFVNEEKITEVWDHHQGFENYWQQKLGNHNIEAVGACATLIWEEFEKKNKPISELSANLLYTAIFSNTLNLSSCNTTIRDTDAASKLLLHTNLPDNWIESYYQETQADILQDLEYAIKNDTKEVNIMGQIITIAQLEFWQVNNFLSIDNIEELMQNLLGKNELWFLTIPCISENKNYFITKSLKTQQLLSDVLGVIFTGNIGSNNHVLLRKEIINILNEAARPDYV